jgi:hypothetical protein
MLLILFWIEMSVHAFIYTYVYLRCLIDADRPAGYLVVANAIAAPLEAMAVFLSAWKKGGGQDCLQEDDAFARQRRRAGAALLVDRRRHDLLLGGKRVSAFCGQARLAVDLSLGAAAAVSLVQVLKASSPLAATRTPTRSLRSAATAATASTSFRPHGSSHFIGFGYVWILGRQENSSPHGALPLRESPIYRMKNCTLDRSNRSLSAN